MSAIRLASGAGVAIAATAILAVAAGGAGGAPGPSVEVATTGNDSELVKTVAITRRAGRRPQVAMSMRPGRLPDLARGDRLRASAELQVTNNCNYRSPRCVGPVYHFDPRVRARLVLAPDAATTGGPDALPLAAPEAETCTQERPDFEHHCVLVRAGHRQAAVRRPGIPETVASSALQSMRAQNRLVPFVARYVLVVSSRQERFGGLVSSERTLILPGDVRYELDLAKLGPEDVQWDAGSSTLSVTLPEIETAGPEVDLAAAREYGEGGVLSVVTDADQALDRNNRARAVAADLRKQAQAAVPMRLAREAGRQAVEQDCALPLQAAGFDNAKVIARYPTEGSPVTKPLDRSRSL